MKIRTLVPLTHPTTGEQFATGTEVDVSDEIAADWRADGKVSSIDDEKKTTGQPQVFDARTGREETTSTRPSAAAPPPKEKK